MYLGCPGRVHFVLKCFKLPLYCPFIYHVSTESLAYIFSRCVGSQSKLVQPCPYNAFRSSHVDLHSLLSPFNCGNYQMSATKHLVTCYLTFLLLVSQPLTHSKILQNFIDCLYRKHFWRICFVSCLLSLFLRILIQETNTSFAILSRISNKYPKEHFSVGMTKVNIIRDRVACRCPAVRDF